jgi:MurNAc alpha-1-phosphate uridylyltransferase
MILAAGRGERMRPLTDRTPKCLLEAGGKPLILWHVERLQAAGCTQIVINHAWLGQQIEDFLGDGSRWGVRIGYSAEGNALETAGGIAKALGLLEGRAFVVVNGDIFTDFDFAALWPRFDTMESASASPLAHLVLVNNPPHHPTGDFALQGDSVITGAKPTYTFSGIGVYRRELFNHIVPGTRVALAPLLRSRMAMGDVTGCKYEGLWLDVGTPERLGEADRIAREHFRKTL